jgi:ABC-type uncharacterized transport system auxiliary subunit
MYSMARIFALMTALVFALSGCQSHQAKIDALQKEYDQINQQFAKDCSAEYLKVPPTLSPKCADENKQMKDAWDQLQAERMKK